jgi:UDP-2-acetamido-2,6-beta-L-arabino-hexul-4-ose reductase
VDDVVRAFIDVLEGAESPKDGGFGLVRPVFHISLGELAGLLTSFAKSRNSLMIPNMDDLLTRRLYATYVSYLPEDAFAYGLVRREDQRGALSEVVKSPHFGQLFFSTTKPGVTRGNHYHDSKIEKFIVISGEAVIRFEHILTGARIDVPASGHEMKVVDIPPGYTHHIENVGKGELVVLFWANELFDQAAPDTCFKEVRRG